jgi:hypothetical protein
MSMEFLYSYDVLMVQRDVAFPSLRIKRDSGASVSRITAESQICLGPAECRHPGAEASCCPDREIPHLYPPSTPKAGRQRKVE